MNCPICGQPTFLVYGKHPRKDGLCKDCSQRLFNGEIEQCPDCGEWKEKGKQCVCTTPIRKKSEQETEEILPASIVFSNGPRCITCGYESTDGKLFCKKCYAKYYNKEILIKIKNCKEIIPLDDFYEGYYECEDGHVVKSMAERAIDDYLFHHNIKHGYEKPLYVEDENGKTITLHPDFCIFNDNLDPLYYIEYWGYDDNNRDYTKTKKFKIPLYERKGITLININAKYDLKNISDRLAFKLSTFKMGILNFLNE